MTGRHDWNIFKSEVLTEFLIFMAIALPVVFAIQLFWHKVVKKQKYSEKKEKDNTTSTE